MRRGSFSWWWVLPWLTTWVVACQPQDPQERVAEVRREYSVRLNAWDAMESEADLVAEEDFEEGIAGETEPGGGEGEEMAAETTEEDLLQETSPAVSGPTPTDILFDVIVRYEGRGEPLPGITLEITHADPFEEVKEVRRHYVETPGIRRNDPQQLSFVLDGWSFEEGDRFSIEVRPVVPPSERSEYREFQEAG